MMSVDARIPVLIVPWPGPGPATQVEPDGRAVLVIVAPDEARSGGTSTPEPGWAVEPGWAAVRRVAPNASPAVMFARELGHGSGCACCAARSPLVETLSQLFRQRALGELPLFARVLLVVPATLADAVSALLISDRLVAGRFRPLVPK